MKNIASVDSDLIVISRDHSNPLSPAAQANLQTCRYEVIPETSFCANVGAYLGCRAVVMPFDPRSAEAYRGSLWNALRSFSNKGGRVLYADAKVHEVAFPQWPASGPDKVGLFDLNPHGYFSDIKPVQPDGTADFRMFAVQPGSPPHLAELAGTAKKSWRNGATIVIESNWVPRKFAPRTSCTGILCYYAEQSLGEFFAAEPGGKLRKERVEKGWGHWTDILHGNFGGQRGCDFLFYNRAGGGEFYGFNEEDKFVRLSDRLGLSDGWTRVIAGRFRRNEDRRSDLLFYNSANGAAHFNRVGAAGSMDTRSVDLGSGWTHIVQGRFVDSESEFDDLLLYRRDSGEYRVCRVCDGSVEWVAEPGRWDAGWSHVVPGRFTGTRKRTDLFLYSHSLPGIGVLAARGDGGFDASIPAWPEFADWKHIVGARLEEGPRTSLVFYRS